MEFKQIDGGILAAEGFIGAAENCGIKPDKLDLVLIHSQKPTSAAATITSNTFRAAPTYITERAVADGSVRTIVANSGNANCATADRGHADATRMARLAAGATGVEAEDTVVCSTGAIGEPLPMGHIEPAIGRLGEKMGRCNDEKLARGIMTTDTHPKMSAAEVELGGTECRIGAMAKGAGMIYPNMATMLCFICTDAAAHYEFLQDTVNWCVERSFNCISTDGCMSTNDTVVLLANGGAGNEPIITSDAGAAEPFRHAISNITRNLAKQIAFDGEGSTKDISIRVAGAETFGQARKIGKMIANYNMFKTSMYGEAFNWGRVAAAVGAAGMNIAPADVTIQIQGITAWGNGEIAEFDQQIAQKAMQKEQIDVDVNVGGGEGEATVWTCDLTEQYVRENM